MLQFHISSQKAYLVNSLLDDGFDGLIQMVMIMLLCVTYGLKKVSASFSRRGFGFRKKLRSIFLMGAVRTRMNHIQLVTCELQNACGWEFPSAIFWKCGKKKSRKLLGNRGCCKFKKREPFCLAPCPSSLG